MMKSAVRHPAARAAALLGRAALVLSIAACLPGCGGDGNTQAAASATDDVAAVARGRVDIEGGLLALTMPRAGTVTDVAVRDGEHVTRGQLLVQLDPEPARLAVDAAQAEAGQALAQQKLIGIRLAAARQRADRLREAAAQGAGDGQSADDATAAGRELAAEEAGARAATQLAQEKLAAARYELTQRRLVAPSDAQVTRVAVQAGASVAPESPPLVTLLPDAPRIVRAELNESFVGIVTPGMAARVSADDGSPDDAWDARVVRVAAVYGPATLESDPQVRANSRTVECVLTFDRPQPQLRIGQRVLVRFATGPAPAPAATAAHPAGSAKD